MTLHLLPKARTIEGRIVHVGPTGTAAAHRRWTTSIGGLLLAAGALLALGLIAVGVLLTVVIVGTLTAILIPRRVVRHAVASRVASGALTGWILRPRRTVPVCDYRFRDPAGREHLVRVEGHLRHGSMILGDDVRAEGIDLHGTLVMKRGWNHSLGIPLSVEDS